MRNVPLVTVSGSLEDLLDHVRGFCLTKYLPSHKLIKQFLAWTKFGHQVDTAFIFIYFVELDNVWVDKVLQNIDLILESNAFSVTEAEFVNDLDHTLLPTRLLLALVHFAELAYTRKL